MQCCIENKAVQALKVGFEQGNIKRSNLRMSSATKPIQTIHLEDKDYIHNPPPTENRKNTHTHSCQPNIHRKTNTKHGG